MHPTAHRRYHRDPNPVTVMTEAGSHTVCGLCAIALLTESGRRVTVKLWIEPLAVHADA